MYNKVILGKKNKRYCFSYDNIIINVNPKYVKPKERKEKERDIIQSLLFQRSGKLHGRGDMT